MRLKTKIPKIGSSKFLLWFSFIISIFIETLITVEVIPDIGVVKALQYFIILGPLGLSLLNILKKKRGRIRSIYFRDGIKTGIILVSTFLILSFIQSFRAGRFSFESIMQGIQMLLPFVFAFVVINELSEDNVDSFMKTAFVATFLGYLFTVFGKDFSLSDVLNISLTNSYSPFENSTFAEIASGLAAYFIYNRKKMPGYCFLVVLLNLLIFKRVLMLMVAVLLILSYTKKQDCVLKRRTVRAIGAAWIVLIFAVFYIYQPDVANFLGISPILPVFTVGRVYRLWYLIENNFVSYGLGCTHELFVNLGYSYLGFDMEMDFIRFMFEIGPIAIIVFISSYLRISRRNLYIFVLINMCFLNLLMANGILLYWGYTMRMITIAFITKKTNEVDRIARSSTVATSYKKLQRG